MTVRELIERLALEDPKMRVVVDGYESGCDEVENIEYARIKPNARKTDDNWWDGEFDYVLDETEEIALVLPRKS
jgi:hypothetical protein